MQTRRLLYEPNASDPAGGNPNVDLEDAGEDLGISDAVALLDIPDALKTAVTAKEKSEAQSPKPKVEEAKAEKKVESPEPRVEAPAAPQWSADQTAWFELRAKATTPEEIATAETQAPAFTDEQRAFLEAQAAELPADGGVPTAPEFTTPEQKAWVAKQTADLAAAQATATATAARIAELEGKVEELVNAPQPLAGDVHPLALVDDATKIDEYEESLDKFIVWAKGNWDGTEEIEATGATPGVRAYTAAEIRTACAKREQELRKTIPAARAALQARQQQVAAARTVYPELFDASKPAGQQVATMLRNFPVLKAIFPNFHIIAGDAYRGEQLRLAEAAKAKAGVKSKLPIPPRPGLKVPPRAGGSGRPATAPAAKAKGEFTAAKFQTALAQAGGNDINALTSLLMNT